MRGWSDCAARPPRPRGARRRRRPRHDPVGEAGRADRAPLGSGVDREEIRDRDRTTFHGGQQGGRSQVNWPRDETRERREGLPYPPGTVHARCPTPWRPSADLRPPRHRDRSSLRRGGAAVLGRVVGARAPSAARAHHGDDAPPLRTLRSRIYSRRDRGGPRGVTPRPSPRPPAPAPWRHPHDDGVGGLRLRPDPRGERLRCRRTSCASGWRSSAPAPPSRRSSPPRAPRRPPRAQSSRPDGDRSAASPRPQRVSCCQGS